MLWYLLLLRQWSPDAIRKYLSKHGPSIEFLSKSNCIHIQSTAMSRCDRIWPVVEEMCGSQCVLLQYHYSYHCYFITFYCDNKYIDHKNNNWRFICLSKWRWILRYTWAMHWNLLLLRWWSPDSKRNLYFNIFTKLEAFFLFVPFVSFITAMSRCERVWPIDQEVRTSQLSFV